MSDFFRYPHTPHLCWLGREAPRGDKVFSRGETDNFLKRRLVVEEKVDGANLGLSIASTGRIQVQNRGQFLQRPYSGQFARLEGWLMERQNVLGRLDSKLIAFGEWCAARHSIHYAALPDWFLLFDVYDKAERRFWSKARVLEFAEQMSLSPMPTLIQEMVTLRELVDLLESTPSQFGAPRMEGFVLRHDQQDWLVQKAKLVRAEFSQQIDEHWRSRPVQWNRVIGV